MDAPTSLAICSLVTTAGGLITIVLQQRSAAHKAEEARILIAEQQKSEALDAARKIEHTSLLAAAIIKTDVVNAAAKVKSDVSVAAAQVQEALSKDAIEKTEKLTEIHVAVNSRLDKALAMIISLRAQLRLSQRSHVKGRSARPHVARKIRGAQAARLSRSATRRTAS